MTLGEIKVRNKKQRISFKFTKKKAREKGKVNEGERKPRKKAK